MRDTAAEGGERAPRRRPRRRFLSASILPAITAGVVIGIIVVLIEVSFAALIFSGDLSVHLPTGVGVLLASSVMLLVVVAVRSSVPVMVAVPQDTVAAITALMAASIAQRLPAVDRDTLFTVIGAMAIASVTIALVLLALGTLKLGNLVRFVPYPVVGGFLAGTGWLLVKGAIGLLADVPVTLRGLSDLFDPAVLSRWMTGLVFAVVLLVALRRQAHFLIIPTMVLGAIGIFYAALLVTGTSVAEAQTNGWLLRQAPTADVWRPLSASALLHADWAAVLGQFGNLATLLVLVIVAILLNATGVELAIGRDVDLNRELRAAGVANLLSGVTGGMAGYQSLSLSVLGPRVGTSSRLVAFTSAAVCGVALVTGPGAVTYFPKPVLGGLIFFLGLGFLAEWVYEARSKLPLADYVIVLLILGIIGAFGFLQGVGAGMIAAIVLFVVNYSRTQLVKHELTGAGYRSKVERPAAERELLREEGDEIRILELQGFIFFGTANSLSEQIRRRALEADQRSLRFIVLDFRRVIGLDSSAILAFEKIRQFAASRAASLILTQVSPVMRRQFEQLEFAETSEVRFFPDLDHGLEWCENQILAKAGPHGISRGPIDGSVEWALPSTVDMGRLMRYVEPVEVPAGETLLRQGDPAEDMYFIESGRMNVLLQMPDGTTKRLRRMMPGTVVGEVSLYLGTPRSSSVVAEEPCKLYRLSRQSLEMMDRDEPDLAAAFHRFVARLTAERLVDLTQAVEDLLR
jgi:sulfate permease, SulP family